MLSERNGARKCEDFRSRMSRTHLLLGDEETPATRHAARVRGCCEAFELQGGGGRARRDTDGDQPPDTPARAAQWPGFVPPEPTAAGVDSMRCAVVPCAEGRSRQL